MSWWMGLPQGQRYPDLYDEFMARKDGDTQRRPSSTHGHITRVMELLGAPNAMRLIFV
jgi:hypothetical protein